MLVCIILYLIYALKQCKNRKKQRYDIGIKFAIYLGLNSLLIKNNIFLLIFC
jgi:hypothetical protein